MRKHQRGGHAFPTPPVMRMICMLAVLPAALFAGGCASYQLQGKVVEGVESSVQVVAADDPRLDEPGVPSARLTLTLDPDRLSAKPLGDGMSRGDGTFALPVDEFGAGWMEHDVGVVAQRSGYQPAMHTFRLPGGSRRLLVTLAPGDDRLPKRRGDLLDETMRLGEPYMGR